MEKQLQFSPSSCIIMNIGRTNSVHIYDRRRLKKERMRKLQELITALPEGFKLEDYQIYPESINRLDDSWIFMVKVEGTDYLAVIGELTKKFKGKDGSGFLLADLNHENASVLREIFPFTAPSAVLGAERTFGVGDRLGIACLGHIRVFREYDARPVFAQQSIRELNLTQRSFADVLDAVTFAVFREGFRNGFGADGDHLKKPEEVEAALECGYTMITLDLSDHINKGDVPDLEIPAEIRQRYLQKTFDVEGEKIAFSEADLKECLHVYGKALNFAAVIYHEYIAPAGGRINFEVSIDETELPTTPAQHYFVANELMVAGVKVDTLAPRFCGEFQKGIDYIGDLERFEEELKIHAAIARKFGYRLSIHSGSDKFSIFELIGKHTRGRFHVKTAGTNWLEAMRLVAMKDPGLYREIHAYALEKFPEAKAFYHVTTDLGRIPKLETVSDEDLPLYFQNDDARQLIHITYGFILNAKNENGSYRFKTRLYELWRKHEDLYSEMLYKHIGKHLKLLYSGSNQGGVEDEI